MMRGMNAAISGLEASQTQLDVTANNLANVNTIGYKSQSVDFVDELSQTIGPATAPNSYSGGTNAQQVGLGVAVGAIENNMSAGTAQTTGNALDLAVSGDGYLVVGNGDPNSSSLTSDLPTSNQYTRAGNLTQNSEGYLTTQSGQYVMGYTAPSGSTPAGAMTYLNIPPGSTNIAIGTNGAVTYTDENSTDATYGQTVTAGYLALATFPNEAGLTRDGGSLLSASVSSGAAQLGTPNTGGFGETISGELEGSNVDMATEFSNMIVAENAYEADSKVITTAQQMLQAIVQMPQG
jgi:flagellar hook protein FlgE